MLKIHAQQRWIAQFKFLNLNNTFSIYRLTKNYYK